MWASYYILYMGEPLRPVLVPESRLEEVERLLHDLEVDAYRGRKR